MDRKGGMAAVDKGNMDQMISPNIPLYAMKDPTELSLEKAHSRWTIGLFLSATIGTLAGLLGLVINGLFLIGVMERTGKISLIATWLIVAAFPLLMLAAHCLDRADAARRSLRLEYCRRHGLKNGES
jgi:hypothetical protein